MKKIIVRWLQARLCELPYDWLRIDAPRLREMKGSEAGRKCFLLANGPSLNKVDFSALESIDLIGLNKIHLLKQKKDLKLKMHVAVNQHVIQQSWREFETLECPSFLNYAYSRNLPVSKNRVRLVGGGPIGFSTPLGKIWEGHTVTYVAIQLAYFLGYEEVYLVGLDHRFTCSGSPNELQTLKGSDPNHFDPNYFANMPWQLPDLAASELAYRIADFRFKQSKRRIYDCTENGACKIFEKLPFGTAVSRCLQR